MSDDANVDMILYQCFLPEEERKLRDIENDVFTFVAPVGAETIDLRE